MKQEIENRFKQIPKSQWNEFIKKLEEKKIELDLIDFSALSPTDTSYEVLLDYLKSQYGITLNESIKELKASQDKFDWLARKECEKEELEAEAEFKKSLETIKKENINLDKYFFTLKHYAKMVAKHYVNGLLLLSPAGYGKTHTTIQAFKESGEDFVFCSGFSTPLQFYSYLFEHKDKNIICDDVSNLLKNDICIDMLKSALYSPKDKRIVSYKTSSSKLEVPSSFIFSGTLTILVNSIKSNSDLKAVADRVLFLELKFSYKEIIEMLFELSKLPYKELVEFERELIVVWIKENTTNVTKNLNLRLLYKVYEMYRYDKDNWKKLAKKIIQNDENLLIVKDLLNKSLSVKEACNEFISSGFGCRSQFYKLKARLEGQNMGMKESISLPKNEYGKLEK